MAHIGIRERDHGQYEKVVAVDYLTACAVLISRGLLEEVGIFDPAFHPAYGEDTDLCLRARKVGFRLLFEPKAKVWHRISASSGGGVTALKVRLRLHHEILLFQRYARWYHWITIPIFVSVRAVGYMVRWIFRGEWGLIGAAGQGVAAVFTSRKKGGKMR
jgi:GT2 family glycosyltransferase